MTNNINTDKDPTKAFAASLKCPENGPGIEEAIAALEDICTKLEGLSDLNLDGFGDLLAELKIVTQQQLEICEKLLDLPDYTSAFENLSTSLTEVVTDLTSLCEKILQGNEDQLAGIQANTTLLESVKACLDQQLAAIEAQAAADTAFYEAQTAEQTATKEAIEALAAAEAACCAAQIAAQEATTASTDAIKESVDALAAAEAACCAAQIAAQEDTTTSTDAIKAAVDALAAAEAACCAAQIAAQEDTTVSTDAIKTAIDALTAAEAQCCADQIAAQQATTTSTDAIKTAIDALTAAEAQCCADQIAAQQATTASTDAIKTAIDAMIAADAACCTAQLDAQVDIKEAIEALQESQSDNSDIIAAIEALEASNETCCAVHSQALLGISDQLQDMATADAAYAQQAEDCCQALQTLLSEQKTLQEAANDTLVSILEELKKPRIGFKTIYKLSGENGVQGYRWSENAAQQGYPEDIWSCFEHVNGQADEELAFGNWNVNDSAFGAVTGEGVSQEMYESYVYFPEQVTLYDENLSVGELLAVYAGNCTQKPLLLKSNEAQTSTDGDSALGEIGVVGPGIVRIIGLVSDATSLGGIKLTESSDGGATKVVIPGERTYLNYPSCECVCVTVDEEGVMTDILTQDAIVWDPNTCMFCKPDCTPIPVDQPSCELKTLYTIPDLSQGKSVKWWSVSDIDNDLTLYTNPDDPFDAVDSEGYPTRSGTPTDGTSTGVSTGQPSLGDGQDIAQFDAWLCLPEDTEIIKLSPRSQMGSVWRSKECGSYEMQEIQFGEYPNSDNLNMGVWPAGFYRVRIYMFDKSDGGFVDLRYINQFGGISPIPEEWILTEKPSVECVDAWACDDGKYYSLDKKEALEVDPSLSAEAGKGIYYKEKPGCPPPSCCETSCELKTLYTILDDNQGKTVQWWTGDNALPDNEASIFKADDPFSEIDGEGYPKHPNNSEPGDSVGLFTGQPSGSQDQAQIDAWVCLPEDLEVRPVKSGLHVFSLWASKQCGSSEMEEKQFAARDDSSASMGVWSAGFHRVRIYTTDLAAAGGASLAYVDDDGNFIVIPDEWLFKQKPSVECVDAWACDDGKYYSFDKKQILNVETTTSIAAEKGSFYKEEPGCSEPAVCNATCSLRTVYAIPETNQGKTVQWWTGDNALQAGSNDTNSLFLPDEPFSKTDNENVTWVDVDGNTVSGYPLHFNDDTPEVGTSTGFSTGQASTTSTRDQAQVDAWICLPEDMQINFVTQGLHVASLWASKDCGSSEMEERHFHAYNDDSNVSLGTWEKGFHRVRIYNNDESQFGQSSLQYIDENGNPQHIPDEWMFTKKPEPECIDAWVCDDGKYYSLDKRKILDVKSTTSLEAEKGAYYKEKPGCSGCVGSWSGC